MEEEVLMIGEEGERDEGEEHDECSDSDGICPNYINQRIKRTKS